MRSHAYPIPPSTAWTINAVLKYGAIALAGGIVLYVLATSDQPAEGWFVLGVWGALTLGGALGCIWGVLRDRYRYEWMGAWGIVAGTATYLAVTVMGTIQTGALTAALAPLTLIWAGLTVPFAALYLIGAARHRRGWKRAGAYGAGTVAALLAASVLTVALGASAPTILVFVYALAWTVDRVIQLSLIDLDARRRVIATRTGEIPEVSVDE